MSDIPPSWHEVPMATAPPDPRYWLLAGPTPIGPFTVVEVHAELAAGRAAWTTPACQVGTTGWMPLLSTPGIGPNAVPVAAVPVPPPVAPTPVTAPVTSSKPAGLKKAVLDGVAIVLALAFTGGLVFAIYNAVRPRTPTEVCEQLNAATTAAEAKKCCTPRMHPVVDAIFAQPDGGDPNDAFEITGEASGTAPNGRRVGFRGTMFLQEAGGRVKMEGYFALLDAGGWKVDDWVISGVEGASLPGPVSLVDEHRKSLAPPPGAKGGDFQYKTTPGTSPLAKKPAPGLFDALSPGTKRWLGVGLLGLGASAVGAVWRWLTRKAGSK